MEKPQCTVLLIEDAPEDREVVRRALAAARSVSTFLRED